MPALRLFDSPIVDIARLRASYRCHAFRSGNGFVRGQGIDSVHFDSGQLFIDDLPVLKVYRGHDRVSWHQQTRDRYTGGHLHFSRGGTELTGMIFTGTSVHDAVPQHILGTTVLPVAYTTQITTQRYPAGTDPNTIPASGWEAGLQMATGYVQQVGSPTPSPVSFLDQQCIDTESTWSIDPTSQNTVLSFTVDPDVICFIDPAFYLQASIEFSVYQPIPTFAGTISSTCADQTGTGVYLWKGTAGPSVDLSCSSQAALGLTTLRTGDYAAPGRHQERPIAMPLTEADLLPADDVLSLTELMTLIPDDGATQMSQDMLVENMKWAMGQDSTETGWLAMVFGEVPPQLTPGRQQLVTQSLSWYQQSFAKAYLGWAITNYSGNGAPSTNLDAAQQLTLKEYLQTGMAQSSDFNTQQNGIYLQAYVATQPRLADYIADPTTDWATQLYDAVTTPAQIILAMNRIFGAAGTPGAMSTVNNFATMLNALQPSGDLATQYVGYFQASSMIGNVYQTAPTSQTTFAEWLPDWLDAFLNYVATNQNVPDSAQLAAQQLQTFIQQNNGSLTQAAAALATFVMDANGSTVLGKANNAALAFAAEFPKLTALGNMLFFASWCTGGVMLGEAFMNWGQLTTEQRVETVTASVTMGMQALASAPDFLQGIRAMGLKGWNQLTEFCASPPANDFYQRLQLNGDEAVAAGAENAADALAPESTSALATLCAGAKTLLGPISVIASGVFAVFSAIKFSNDLKSGAPTLQIAFDGVMMATQIASTVCLAVGLAIGSVVFAFAAAVFGIIGVVVAIVEMFELKPVSPLQAFMNDTVIPFVNGLPPQTPPPTASLTLAIAR
jgi:hypothetical protein